MSFAERHWDAINRREILIVDCSNPLTLGNLVHERMVRALEGKENTEIEIVARAFKNLADNILTAPASRIKKGKGPRDKWGKLK